MILPASQTKHLPSRSASVFILTTVVWSTTEVFEGFKHFEEKKIPELRPLVTWVKMSKNVHYNRLLDLLFFLFSIIPRFNRK